MSDPAESLRELRELAGRHGIPLDVVESLALPYARAARLLGIGLRTVEKLVAEGELSVVVVAENCPRIETVELLRYMDRKRERRGAQRGGSVRDQALSIIDGDRV